MLLGEGLQLKTVQRMVGYGVVEQPIDSSWFSAYADAGIVGVCLLAGAVVVALDTVRRTRSLSIATVLVAVLVGSYSESSLADVSFALVLLAGLPAALIASIATGDPQEPELVRRTSSSQSHVITGAPCLPSGDDTCQDESPPMGADAVDQRDGERPQTRLCSSSRWVVVKA
jgi:hypothetical protein